MSAEKRHPLPASEEARGAEIPEKLREEKGVGDDPAEAVQPTEPAIAPDGEPYGGAPGKR
jgi:hypothetical protein